jgi:hypothetical protein
MLKRIIGLLFPQSQPAPYASLKLTGNRIMVNVQDCTINTSCYYEEATDSEELEVHMLDGLTVHRSDEMQEKEICYLSCTYQPDQHTHMELLSPYIYKDSVTVYFLLERRKQICIYLNPSDCREYYFDLDFMNA